MKAKGESAGKRWLDDRVGYQADDCLIWPFSHARGYGHFTVNRRHIYAHRYMCEMVNGEPPTPTHQAAHSCGNGHKGCVNPRHLSWKTPSGNQLDRRQHGTKNRSYGRSGKLTPTQVEQIRALAPGKTQDELAAMFDTARSNIQFILAGKTRVQVYGLERQRIRTALSRSKKPLSTPEIKTAARLVNARAASCMLLRMVQDGEIVRASYGFYTVPRQPPKHP